MALGKIYLSYWTPVVTCLNEVLDQINLRFFLVPQFYDSVEENNSKELITTMFKFIIHAFNVNKIGGELL